MNPDIQRISAGTNDYLVTQQIQPGQRTLSKIYGMAHRIPIISGKTACPKNFSRQPELEQSSVVTWVCGAPLASVTACQRFQFERHRYLVTALLDHARPLNGGEGKPVFNRGKGMKDSWVASKENFVTSKAN